MNLVLIGYRGTGKTTVGRLLSDRLGWPCLDADAEIERRAGKTIKQIFADEGESAFRDWESRVIADLTELPEVILSLGGGAILRAENRAAIARQGVVVWLTASPETVFARINADPTTGARRPNLTAQGGYEEIVKLLEQRTPLYAAAAQFTLATDDRTPEQLCDELLKLIP